MKRILLAYDGSAGLEAAATALSEAGSSAGLEVKVLNVVEVWIPPHGAMHMENEAELTPEVRAARRRALEAVRTGGQLAAGIARRLQMLHPTWTVEAVVSTSPAAEAIVGLAEEWGADLIVLGSRRRSFLDRCLFRGITRAVLKKAPCSVEIVKPRGNREPLHTYETPGAGNARVARLAA